MAEGFRVATGYVEVVAEIERDSIRRTSERAGDEAGETIGRRAGKRAAVSFGDSMGQVLRGNVTAIFSNPYLLAGVAAAGASLAPALGAGIAGGLIGGAGLGVIVGGIALIADDPRVSAAGKRLGEKLLGGLRTQARPMIEPVLAAIGMFDKALDRILPKIGEMFSMMARSGAIEALAGAMIGFVENALPGMLKLVAAAGPFLKQIAPGFAELGKGVSFFAEQIALAGPDATAFFGDLFRFISQQIMVWGFLIRVLARFYGMVRDVLTGTVGALGRAGAAFNAFRGRVVLAVTGAVSTLRSIWSNGIAAVVSIATGAPGRVGAALAGIVGRVRGVLTAARSAAVSVAGSLVSGVISVLRTLAGRAGAAVSGVAGAITGRLRAAASAAFGIGQAIIQGVISGITSMIGAAVSAASNAVGAIVRGAKGALGIGSPSKVMAREVGRWMLPGLVAGVESTVPAATRAVAQATQAVVPAVPAGAGSGASGAQSGPGVGVTYYFAPGSITIDASRLRSIGDLVRMIENLQVTARAAHARTITVGAAR